MKTNFILKALALISVSVLPLQMYSNQSSMEGAVEENQPVLPHVVHIGAGYSYIASQSSLKLKNGGAVELGYEYLFPKSHWSVGVICTGHYSGGIIRTNGGWIGVPGMHGNGFQTAPPATNKDMLICNITPTIGGYWSWSKHCVKTSVGVGCMNKVVWSDVEPATMKRSRSYDGGLSSYLSLEYEYRPYQDTGIFVRLHDMMQHEKENNGEWDWKNIVGYGVSIGFNFHF